MAIELLRVRKRFGWRSSDAVHDISLTIPEGTVVGLVGLNGAGKTTSIRMAAGTILPTDGRVLVDGLDIVEEKPEASRRLAWVPEAPFHDPDATLLGLLGYYAGLDARWGRKEAGTALDRWGLAGSSRRPFRSLSLGMRKRFSLALADLQSSKYLLLDEVFNGLDPKGIAQAREWILARRAAGAGVLLSSHQLGEVQGLANRFAIVHKGRLVRELDRSELPPPVCQHLILELTRPAEPVVQLLEQFGTVEADGAIYRLSGPDLPVPQVAEAVVKAGYALRRLQPEEGDLESYFLSLVAAAS